MQAKIEDAYKRNCEKLGYELSAKAGLSCAKYGIVPPVQAPTTDPIEYQKQQLQQKRDDLWKKFSAEVAPRRDAIGETEYKKQYDELQKQTESLELKIAALDSGREQAQRDAENKCEAGTHADYSGNCLTAEQLKMKQRKTGKNIDPQAVDDIESLKQENAKLNAKIDTLTKQVNALDVLVKQLKAIIDKITG